MDDVGLVQHIERDTEATPFPLSVTDDWLEDGNETSGNQFQQPDWQVEGHGTDDKRNRWKINGHNQ